MAKHWTSYQQNSGQWDATTQFVVQISKDQKRVPKSMNFKRLYTLLSTNEKAVTKVSLEFFSDIVQVLEQLLLVFQKETPTVHIMYDTFF